MPRMSRIKKKNRMKKEVLKSCLVAVLIGSIGTVGSFAYFTSHAKVDSNLSVSTGTIKVALGDNIGNVTNSIIHISDLKPGNSSGKSTFKIMNNGNLNEKVVLTVNETSDGTPSELLSKISYDIIFNGNDKQSGNMNESKKFIPKDGHTPITLKPGNSITCDFMATLKTTENDGKPLDDKYANTKIQFPVTVKAVQVNDEKDLN